MKFVKENLTLLICGVVALLFLVFAFAPIPLAVPTLRADLQDTMKTRYEHRTFIEGLAKEKLVLPGWPEAVGVPPQSWVDAKQRLIKDINDQQVKVEAAARAGNMKGRLEGKVPVLPVPNNANPALMQGTPMAGLLPKLTQVSSMDFKSKYEAQFPAWRGLLATGQVVVADPDAAVPPKLEKMKAEFDDELKARQATLAPGLAQPGAAGPDVSAQAQREFRDRVKRLVMNKAAGLRMYVETNAFQERSWLVLDAPPDEAQIFEGFVDSWFQSDLVKAIMTVNKENPVGGNVGKSPIKRLTRVVIGNNARTRYLNNGTAGAGAAAAGQTIDPGQLFFTTTSAATLIPGTGIPVTGPSVEAGNRGVASTRPTTGVVLPETPNPTDYTLGMNGRAAGKSYDVVYMSVVLDLDPAALFKFIDQFYRENMCYSLVSVQQRAVDPLDRASNGYLYGDGQVIEVELLFECILFRSWTEPLMPDAVKLTLGGTTPGG